MRERARTVSLPPSKPDDEIVAAPVVAPSPLIAPEAGLRMIGSRPERTDQPGRTYTGVGVVMEAIGAGKVLSAELAETKAKLRELDGSTLVKSLDPTTICRSQWANRVEAEFVTKEFLELKEEIASAGGNVQPIKVRVSPRGDSVEYEIVFGHRRHQACLELGIPVNAIVEVSMSDQDLFAEMDRENRARKNLSAWEQGRTYEAALKAGLYSSLRQLAENLGVDQGNATKANQLAKLPKDVVAAFATPLDLQVRWAKLLTDAVQKDPDGVIQRARALAKHREGLDAAAIFDRLVGKESKPKVPGIEIAAGGKRAATLRTGPNGKAILEFEAGALLVEWHAQLAKIVQVFLEGEASRSRGDVPYITLVERLESALGDE